MVEIKNILIENNDDTLISAIMFDIIEQDKYKYNLLAILILKAIFDMCTKVHFRCRN